MSDIFESFINNVNLFDIFVLIIFIYCIVQCFINGFSLSLISFMKWVISTIVTIILVPKPFCIIALFFLSVGDTFAALIGMNYPFLKIGRKTLSGSIACFVTCCIIGLLFSFKVDTSIIIIGSLIATLTELSSLRINDNLSIPIFSGLAMYFINIVL